MPSLVVVGIIGLAGGVLSALFGIGGGLVVVPAALLAVGLLLGAYLGARIGTTLSPEVAQRAFGVSLAIVGVRLIIS